MTALADIIGDYDAFLTEIFAMIEDIDLEVEDLELDHLCFRVKTKEEYSKKKEELLPFGVLLAESFLAGRPVATFKLKEPIIFRNRKIYLVELPAPKAGRPHSTGLEHVEFVTKLPLQKVVNRYPQLKFETLGINKKINADITLKLGKYCLRFHNQNLEQVIAQERNPHYRK